MRITAVVNRFMLLARRQFTIACILVGLVSVLAMSVWGEEANPAIPAGATLPSTQRAEVAVPAGLRLFTVGHSFHANWLPRRLAAVAASAGVKGHTQVGFSFLGGSRVIQHWNLPDEKNPAKAALREGKVDVLTLSPMLSPDEGILDFANLALEHNPNIRITVQEFWLPFDRLDCFGEKSYGTKAKELRDWDDPKPLDPKKPDTAHFDIPTAEQIRKLHEPYFATMDAYITEQNKQFGKQVLFVVPVGQAVVALREKIIQGKAPGLHKQSELFTDTLGHPGDVIAELSAYCHLAVIYHINPIGLPVPASLAKLVRKEDSPALARLLQELAWDAVTHHPLSGVTGN